MEDLDIASISINFIASIFLYMVYPVLIYTGKEPLTKKEVISTSIINSIVVFFIFVIGFTIMKKDGFPSSAPAFIYGGINYWLLSKRIKETPPEEKTVDEEDEKLKKLINNIEKNNK